MARKPKDGMVDVTIGLPEDLLDSLLEISGYAGTDVETVAKVCIGIFVWQADQLEIELDGGDS